MLTGADRTHGNHATTRSVQCLTNVLSPEKPHSALVLVPALYHQATHQETDPDPGWVLELHASSCSTAKVVGSHPVS